MNNEQLHKKAEDYGNTWIGSDIAWAAAKSGFIVGATEVVDNPELYDLVKKDKYAGEEIFLKENKLLKEDIKRYKAILASLAKEAERITNY